MFLKNKQAVVLGDSTSGAGKVIEILQKIHFINNLPVACVDDKVSCVKHKGVFTIIEGDEGFLINGKAVAIDKSRLSCGCYLIAGTHNFLPLKENEKLINNLYFSYSKKHIFISEVSRYSVDLNLHIEGQNFADGEEAEITVELSHKSFNLTVQMFDNKACVERFLENESLKFDYDNIWSEAELIELSKNDFN